MDGSRALSNIFLTGSCELPSLAAFLLLEYHPATDIEIMGARLDGATAKMGLRLGGATASGLGLCPIEGIFLLFPCVQTGI